MIGAWRIGFDPALTYARMEALRESCPWAHVVVAGGISSKLETFCQLERLTSLQEHLSCDAESGLRTTDDDDLDIAEVQHYLKSVHLGFHRGLFGGAMR